MISIQWVVISLYVYMYIHSVGCDFRSMTRDFFICIYLSSKGSDFFVISVHVYIYIFNGS